MLRLGRWVGRHAQVVLVVWLVLAISGLGAALGWYGNESLFDRLSQGAPTVPSDSKTADDIIADHSSRPSVMVRVDGASIADPAVATAGEQVQQQLSALTGVKQVASPFMVPGPQLAPAEQALVSPSKPTSFVILVTTDPGVADATERDVVRQAQTLTTKAFPGATVTVGGERPLTDRITEQVRKDLARGEGFAVPVSLVVMVFVFGGLIAATLPIIGALAVIAGALALLLGLSHVMSLDATVVNIVTIMGLALSIDYGLLFVNRFREELVHLAPDGSRTSLDREHLVEAIGRSTATAGRTVLFSALIVGISISGLIVFASPIIKAVGVAGASVVLVALISSLTLVPAVCMIAGRRLLPKNLQAARDEGVFASLARGVQRAKFVVVVACVAVLVLMALPITGMRGTSSGPELLPVDTPERVFFTDLGRDFPQLATPTATVVAKTDVASAKTWAASLPGKVTDEGAVEQVAELGDGWVTISFDAKHAAVGNDIGQQLVKDLRASPAPFQTYVTGPSARQHDFLQSTRDRAPWAILMVGLATMVMLFLMTGSIVLPIKALIFNVLSMGAAMGAMTFIFQNGHGERLLGFTSVGGIETIVPIIMLAFGFGLSMDYEVFLLSRIVELHEQGKNDLDAVRLGVQRSGRIITSAALLILIVLLGLLIARMLAIQEIGFGMFIAVLIDASIVRMLLVPATMSVLGTWNWWAPGLLRRLHDRWGLSESGEFDDPEHLVALRSAASAQSPVDPSTVRGR